jgi:hypothetical protein
LTDFVTKSDVQHVTNGFSIRNAQATSIVSAHRRKTHATDTSLATVAEYAIAAFLVVLTFVTKLALLGVLVTESAVQLLVAIIARPFARPRRAAGQIEGTTDLGAGKEFNVATITDLFTIAPNAVVAFCIGSAFIG